MKIVTWNVNSLKARIDIVLEWIKEQQPDFLLLQEIKGLDEDIFNQFEELGYYSYFKLQKSYNGVATLSKIPCTITRNRLPDFEDEQARLLEISFEDTLIINCYVPNGNPILSEKYDYKIKWLNTLYKYLESLTKEDKNFLIAGDFNIAPRDIDTYSIKALKDDAIFQKDVRDIYFSILNLGLLDVIDYKYKNQEKIYTWWDYRNGGFAKNQGVRIDHILLSPLLVDKYSDCYIDKNPRIKDRPSDHTPVICSLR